MPEATKFFAGVNDPRRLHRDRQLRRPGDESSVNVT